MKFDAVPSIDHALESTLDAFRAGDFSRAESQAEEALTVDFEHPEVQSALKCAVFWKDRTARLDTLGTPEERGDFLLKEWNGFLHRFRVHLDSPFELGVTAIQGAILDAAAGYFLEQVDLEDESRRPELLAKAAKTYKANGSFDRALGCLEKILQVRPDDAAALADMADCFEAVGDTEKARLLFREAFYLNAPAVDVDGLRSPLIRDVAAQLAAEGFAGAELKEWIPVHAVVKGIFTVKRDLKTLEVGQLKQSINALKSELHDHDENRPTVLPKLLNRYFWLIDHFFSAKEERSKVEDILLNIKLLDERIYELYTH